MRFTATLFFILLTLAKAFSQSLSGRISGTVTDKNTQEYLMGATVSIYDTDTLYTQTDENGGFEFNAPVGKYNLKVQLMGYQEVLQYNINVNTGNAQVISIELQNKAEELKEVEINLARSAQATDMITPCRRRN